MKTITVKLVVEDCCADYAFERMAKALEGMADIPMSEFGVGDSTEEEQAKKRRFDQELGGE